MKKLFSVLMVLSMMASLLVTTASAAPAALLTQTAELGQLKVCKVAGTGVTVGTTFNFRVNGSSYSVPAGPADRNGYCILAGQYPVGSQVTIEEMIPSGYFVSRIEVKPERTISRNTAQGIVTVQIVSGVIEAIFTNKAEGSQTPTPDVTATPRPTKTATSTPSCDPNCTPTSTPVPMGRMQICKEADGSGVTGSFTFRFATRSRTVPVGACAGLIAVEAGTLTVTEVAQTGYSVADIYTIPADRLIGKDLAAGTATLRIVEGTAASQTIVIFRNRRVTNDTATPTSTGITPTPSFTATPTGSLTSTPTFTPTSTGTTATPTNTPTFTPTATGSITPTFTPTPTSTEPVLCPPSVIYANFTNVPAGQSVEGIGKVAPYLNIDANNGTAVRVIQATQPAMYFAPNGSGNINGGLVADGGFSDQTAQAARQPHLYTFTFSPGVTITNFSLHMLDYGDWNYAQTIDHLVTMTAYGATGQPVPNAQQVLSYTTPPDAGPRASNLYGDLSINGDAVTAPPGQPGNWIWSVSGAGITKVVLEFGVGYDPNIAFDLLSFTTECSSCQSYISGNMSNVPVGQSVEGLGRIAPHLSIDANNGTAVRVTQATQPMMYIAPNGSTNINGGLVADGGFSDQDAQAARRAHLYTFTFAPGVTITNFSLHMLDYGDWNYPQTSDHLVTMTAYGVNGQPIPNAQEVLRYTTPAQAAPRSSDLYGDLLYNGDAVSAPLGQPGNWIWNVAGNGISKVVLEFGVGYDPNVAFDLLSYNVVCQ